MVTTNHEHIEQAIERARIPESGSAWRKSVSIM